MMAAIAASWERAMDQNPNSNRLYRNAECGKLFGVCAGVGDYFGLPHALVRVAWVGWLFVFFGPALLTYLIMALAVSRRPAQPIVIYVDDEQPAATRPAAATLNLAVVRASYDAIDQRLAKLERVVASREFQVGRAIRELDR